VEAEIQDELNIQLNINRKICENGKQRGGTR
jgi:hypothetical protein